MFFLLHKFVPKVILDMLLITQAHKKSGMNFTCKYTTPIDFEPLNLNPVSEFLLDPQLSPSLGEMREILEILVSVKAILIYSILNKTLMFSRNFTVEFP